MRAETFINKKWIGINGNRKRSDFEQFFFKKKKQKCWRTGLGGPPVISALRTWREGNLRNRMAARLAESTGSPERPCVVGNSGER